MTHLVGNSTWFLGFGPSFGSRFFGTPSVFPILLIKKWIFHFWSGNFSFTTENSILVILILKIMFFWLKASSLRNSKMFRTFENSFENVQNILYMSSEMFRTLSICHSEMFRTFSICYSKMFRTKCYNDVKNVQNILEATNTHCELFRTFGDVMLWTMT